MMKGQEGHSLTDYACGIVLIGCVAVGGLQLLGGNLNGLLGGVSNPVKGYQNEILKPTTAKVAAASIASQMPAMDRSAPLVGKPLNVMASNQAALLQQVQPYNPNQVAGSNGVDIVRGYANSILAVATALKADPDADPGLLNLLTQLANEGHGVADTERIVMGSSGSGGVRLNSAEYEIRKAEVINYLSQNPQALPADLTQIVRVSADNITAQVKDFVGPGNDPNGFLNQDTVNVNFRKAVTGSSNTICKSGGDTSKCVK